MAMWDNKPKRLAKNAYPQTMDGEVNQYDIDKLVYYSNNSPDQVSIVAKYFYKKVTRHVRRNRNKKLYWVKKTMEIFDVLIKNCHGHALAVYVNTFLLLVQELLDSNDAQLIEVATSKFEEFSLLRHQNLIHCNGYDYDLFVGKFSNLAKSQTDDLTVRKLGITGIKAVLRLEVTDDIWKPAQMDEILSALLFNMNTSNDPTLQDHPSYLAEKCFKDLFVSATYIQIRSMLQSIFTYFDTSGLWSPIDFPIRISTMVMHTVQSRHAKTVIVSTLTHVETSECAIAMKKYQVEILVAIIEEKYPGPFVFDILDFLINQIVGNGADVDYVSYLVSHVYTLCLKVPVYVKHEVLIFITNKLTLISLSEGHLLELIFKIFHRVIVHFKTGCPHRIIDPLLHLMSDPSTTVQAQKGFQLMFDHGNLKHLSMPTDLGFELKKESVPAQSLQIINVHGVRIYSALVQPLQKIEMNVLPWYKSLGLISVMIRNEKAPDFVACLLKLQEIAVERHESAVFSLNLHCICASLVRLLASGLQSSKLLNYAKKLIEKRKKFEPQMFQFHRDNMKIEGIKNPQSLIQCNEILSFFATGADLCTEH